MINPLHSPLRTLAFILLSLVGNQAQADEHYPMRYMGGEATLATAPNGAVINAEVLASYPQIVYTEKTVDKVADGVWVIGGYSIANCTVIEAPDGLVVYDTGDYAEEGAILRKVIEEQISKKPIKAIIYSHSHYALGGGAMVDDPESVEVLGHPKLNETVEANLQGGGVSGDIPEIGPVMTARMLVQFSNFLPSEGPDATLAGRIKIKPPAFLPVTRAVQNGELVDVAGLQMQFFTDYVSDDYSVTVWIPQKKLALNNFYWPGTVNLYSLRGAAYRDPQVWRDGLKVLRDLQPEYLASTHTRAVKGQELVSETLTNYMDMITLTYDQSLRGILKGLGPDDLRYFVYKPKHLAEPAYNKELYGETPWFTPAMYYYGLGWYDRDATKMFQLPLKDESKRLVELMGGRDKVLAAAQSALDNKEYAWAAQLVNRLYVIDPQDSSARQVKIDALRKLGQLTTASIGRSFALSEARGLEGSETIPSLVLPKPEAVAASPDIFVNYHRVRIDPRKAENTDKVLAFSFHDQVVGLHVRRGVVEFIPDISGYYRQPDITMTLDGDAWARMYLNQSTLGQELTSGKVKVTQGDAGEAEAILAMFDALEPTPNLSIPPLNK